MELNVPVLPFAISLDLVMRLLGATLAGLVLGLDREVRGYGAGLRTHAIVCLAAALAAVTAIALFYALGGTQTRSDPLRVIEGTAAAIGVIAAALIFIGERSVRNLTSATYLWLVATIGIAFGAGLYPVALIGTVLGLLLLTVARMFEDKPFGAHDDGQG